MQLMNYRVVPPSYLDRIRLQSGGDTLKRHFLKMVKEHRKQAILHMNADHLHFATLFLLLPEINVLNLYEELNKRNRAAIALLGKVSEHFKYVPHSKENLLGDSESVRAALKWMLLTGIPDDGLNDMFDQILDTAASLLLQNHGSSYMLPSLVRLLFRRNRKGRYIHDLAWALFRSQDLDCLRLIAERLRSSNKKDVALAQSLLRYNGKTAVKSPKQWRYASFVSWFEENRPFLAFTGDNFNRTSAPALFRVDLDAKYLATKRLLQEQNALDPLARTDHPCLDDFHDATAAEQLLLANYSYRLHVQNKKQWKDWMVYPVKKQIQIAQGRQGEHHD